MDVHFLLIFLVGVPWYLEAWQARSNARLVRRAREVMDLELDLLA